MRSGEQFHHSFRQFSGQNSRRFAAYVQCFVLFILRAFMVFGMLRLNYLYKTNQSNLEVISTRLEFSEIVPVYDYVCFSGLFIKKLLDI